MGGPNTPDDLRLGHLTQEWLAAIPEAAALVTGGYWHHQRRAEPDPAALDPSLQAPLLASLEQATGIALPPP
jgi:hypothetical protein